MKLMTWHRRRDSRGRFLPINTPETVASVQRAINKMLSVKPDSQTGNRIAAALSVLTVRQIHGLKRLYGLKASARRKLQLIDKLTARLLELERFEPFTALELDSMCGIELPESRGDYFYSESDAPGRCRSFDRICGYQAERWDMATEHYREVANRVWQTRASEHNERETARKTAREWLRINAGTVNRLENKGFDYGSGKVRQLDTVGRELALHFPALGWGEDHHEYDRLVWELVQQGSEKIWKKSSPEFHDAIESELSAMMN